MSSESTERAYSMHTPNANPRLRFFLPIYIGSLTSAPFCITVHRPGRLPIMSLYSYKDKLPVYRKFGLDKRFLNFLEATHDRSLCDTIAEREKYDDSCLAWWDLNRTRFSWKTQATNKRYWIAQISFFLSKHKYYKNQTVKSNNCCNIQFINKCLNYDAIKS